MMLWMEFYVFEWNDLVVNIYVFEKYWVSLFIFFMFEFLYFLLIILLIY